MTIFAVGSRGFILQRAVPALRRDGLHVVGVSSHPTPEERPLNLEAAGEFAYQELGPGDVVLMAAAISSPDVCKNKKDYATSVNVTGTSRFLEGCLERGARVVFFSSDTVYGERTEEALESAVPTPVGEYAAMKAEVEQRFAGHDRFRVLRLSYVVARQDKFSSYLAACAEKGEAAELFHPIRRRAVDIEDLIEVLRRASRDAGALAGPVTNVAGPELLSRVELAERFRDATKRPLALKVIEPEPAFFEARPKTIDISCAAFARALGRPPTFVAETYAREFN